MFRAVTLLALVAVAGCKAAPKDPKQLSDEEMEFMLQVNERVEAYEKARVAGLLEDQINEKHACQRIADERRETVLKAAQCNNPNDRAVAIAVLGFSLKDEVIKHLVDGLLDPDKNVQVKALWGLFVHGSDQTPVQPLVALLDNPDPDLRLGSMAALTKILRRNQDKGAMPKILEKLSDADWRVRGQALLVLAVVQRRDTIKAIVEKSLKDDATEVRWRAVGALVAIAEPDVVDPLIGALSDPDERVIEFAMKSLERLSGQKFGRDPEKWVVWWTKRRELGLGLEH